MAPNRPQDAAFVILCQRELDSRQQGGSRMIYFLGQREREAVTVREKTQYPHVGRSHEDEDHGLFMVYQHNTWGP